MAIIVVMISLGAKVINSVTGNQSLGQINSTVADILNDARNQAMARNTYVWVGFANVTDSYSSKLTLAAVESVTGQASDLSANPPVTKVVMPLRSFIGVGIDSTLSIPGMILGETALSFLGLGIRPPMTSWGVLLSEAQRVTVVLNYPWLLFAAAPVVLVVIAYNFVGDALRDAADPYSQ